jgi:hypothetical protein
MTEAKAAALAVLVDANILVKDVVSNVLYDLHSSGQIDLHWTPEIEAEYIRHRARLRAAASMRPIDDCDLEWASARIEVIKNRIVKRSAPPGWVEESTLAGMMEDKVYEALLGLPDKDDVHVALGAAYLAKQLGRAIVLTTENLSDLPADTLRPFKVATMHQGDLLDILHGRDPEALSQSILKTARDFKNPEITPEMMLRSIASKTQFWNPDLAEALEKAWGVESEASQNKRGRSKGAGIIL